MAENEHIKKLMAARIRLVADRRNVAEILGKEIKRGDTEGARDLFVSLQNTIEAIDRAIEDERRVDAG